MKIKGITENKMEQPEKALNQGLTAVLPDYVTKNCREIAECIDGGGTDSIEALKEVVLDLGKKIYLQTVSDVTAKLEENKTPEKTPDHGKYVEYFSKYIVLREKHDDLKPGSTEQIIISSRIDLLHDSIMNEDFNLADSVIVAINIFFEKIKDLHDSKKAQKDKLAWWDSLERLKVPHIGRLADHIIQNGLGEVECFTKKLIFQYGTKMIASWWDEYRGEKIDF